MGGWGSGPRTPGGKKRAVERCWAVDARDLRARLLAGGVHTGVIRPTPGGQPVGRYELAVGDGHAVLRLGLPGGDGPPTGPAVRLEAVPGHSGGVRWFCVCPRAGCGRRVRAVYDGPGGPACRHCHRLTYTSTQESDRRVCAAVASGYDPGAARLDRGGVRALGFALKVIRHRDRRSARRRMVVVFD